MRKVVVFALLGLLILAPSAAFAAEEAATNPEALAAYDEAYAAKKAADEAYEEAKKAAGVQEEANILETPIIPTMMEFIPMVITFSILVVVMGKFVWPVALKALDERAEKIEGSLKKAEEAKIEAEDILTDSQEKLSEARKESAVIVDAGKSAGETARADIVKRAEEEAAEIVARGSASVEAERAAMIAGIKEESARLAVSIAAKILGEKITDDIDAKIIKESIAEMGGFND